MIGADPAKVPAQDHAPKDAAGKQVSDLVSEDTKIDPDGAVIGTLYQVSGMTAYGEGEQEGHYFPLLLDEKYDGKEITVKRDGTVRADKVKDLDWVLYVPDIGVSFTFETEEDGVFLTLTFSGVTLA